MFPIIQIGPLALQAQGLIYLIGIWIGLTLAEKLAPKVKFPAGHIWNAASLALIFGLIGARLSYVVLHWDVFAESPGSIFSLNLQLFDLWGGIIFSALAILIFGQRKHFRWLNFFDASTPLLGVFLVAHSLANLAVGTGFGRPSELPWAINLWGANRHPSQIYEICASLLVLAVIIFLIYRQPSLPAGVIFFLFSALSSTWRLILEYFRADSNLIFQLRTGQVISWLILAVSLYVINKLFYPITTEKG
jgi:phosphatidylglycerol:prolipoprotein diacylglycerol transferase